MAAAREKAKTPVGDPKRAIAHVRVSTDEQQLGQDVQRAAISEWAARSGIEIMAWTEDVGVSGGAELEDRPGLGEALGLMVAYDAGVLVVSRRDRLARSVAVAVAVERAVASIGGRIVAADGVAVADTAEDRMVRTILDAVAEYERMTIRLRIRAAAAAAKKNLERWGGVPWGYDERDGKLVANAQELEIADRIIELRGEGWSWDQIAAALNRVRESKTGKKWYGNTVRRIFIAAEARAQLGKAAH